VRTVCCAFLQRSCEWISILYVANSPRPLLNGSSATRCLPNTTCNATLTFSVNSNITTTLFPRSMLRITVLDEYYYFSKLPKFPQISIFCTPVSSGSYDVWGGTLANKPLNTNTIYITFTAYLTEMHETKCFALQINRPSPLPTVRNHTDIFK
jgi:hypothetical protein